MRTRSLSIVAVLAAAFVIGTAGCGGGGGGSSSGGGSGTGGNPNGNGSLGASMTLVGGFLDSAAAAGSTTTVVLTDHNGNTHSFPNVYTPDALNGPADDVAVAIVRAGSNLFSGHYTSTTAKYVNTTENFSSTIPLTGSGALAQDTLIPLGAQIVLPINTIGKYSFPNGVTVNIDTGPVNYSVQNNTLSFTATIPPATSTPGTLSSNIGQMTFTDTGAVSPQASMTLQFTSVDTLSQVIITTPGTTNPTSPVPLQGTAYGSSTVMTVANATYDLED